MNLLSQQIFYCVKEKAVSLNGHLDHRGLQRTTKITLFFS